MDQAFVGRSLDFPEPYEVGIEKIRQFADAIGDDNSLYHDRVAAQFAGHPSVVAPPTFAIQVIARAQDAVMFDPSLGLDFSRVVHLDQRFVYQRPIFAGDVLSCVVTVESIKVLAGNDVITVRTDVSSADGSTVVSCWGTLVSRG